MSDHAQAQSPTNKKKRFRSEVRQNQTDQFLKRKILKPQNLDRNLRKSYEKNFFKQSRFSHFQQLKKIRNGKENDSVESEYADDSEFVVEEGKKKSKHKPQSKKEQDQSSVSQKAKPKAIKKNQNLSKEKIKKETKKKKESQSSTSSQGSESKSRSNSASESGSRGSKSGSESESVSKSSSSSNKKSSNHELDKINNKKGEKTDLHKKQDNQKINKKQAKQIDEEKQSNEQGGKANQTKQPIFKQNNFESKDEADEAQIQNQQNPQVEEKFQQKILPVAKNFAPRAIRGVVRKETDNSRKHKLKQSDEESDYAPNKKEALKIKKNKPKSSSSEESSSQTPKQKKNNITQKSVAEQKNPKIESKQIKKQTKTVKTENQKIEKMNQNKKNIEQNQSNNNFQKHDKLKPANDKQVDRQKIIKQEVAGQKILKQEKQKTGGKADESIEKRIVAKYINILKKEKQSNAGSELDDCSLDKLKQEKTSKRRLSQIYTSSEKKSRLKIENKVVLESIFVSKIPNFSFPSDSFSAKGFQHAPCCPFSKQFLRKKMVQDEVGFPIFDELEEHEFVKQELLKNSKNKSVLKLEQEEIDKQSQFYFKNKSKQNAKRVVDKQKQKEIKLQQNSETYEPRITRSNQGYSKTGRVIPNEFEGSKQNRHHRNESRQQNKRKVQMKRNQNSEQAKRIGRVKLQTKSRRIMN